MLSAGRPKNGQIPRPTWRKDRQAFEVKITLGYRNGKRYRKSVYGKTERECLSKVFELFNQSPSALLANVEKYTLQAWLEKYIEIKAPNVRPSTVLKYRQYLGYILPTLGPTPLLEVKSIHLDLFFSGLAARGLSPSIRRQAFFFLKDALRRAYLHDLIPGNPMEKLDPPKGGKVRETGAWTPIEARRVLATSEGTRWYALIAFALTTALRPGELLGLNWADIRGGWLEVRRTLLEAGPTPLFGPPKTKTSARVIPLDEGTLTLLEGHRTSVEEHKALAGDCWSEHGLVFPSLVGTPININNFRRALHVLATQAGVSLRSPHELRHTSITLHRGRGDVNLVSRKAGHSDTIITDKIYNHPQLEDLRRVAFPLSELLKAPGEDDK